MIDTIQFQPTQSTTAPPFAFQATLLNPTSNVTSTDTLFSCVMTWNVYGQRWYFSVYDQSNNLVLTLALVASPPGYSINLVAGYFSSSVVFLEATQQFVVTP